MNSHLVDDVGNLLRQAAESAILPRFRRLASGDVEEKTPGEVVTVADREAEAILSRGLAALLPGSRVVGEEAVAADAALLDGLDRGIVWLVDPLDGTGNFVAGQAPFSVMAALLRDGEAVGAWMLDPLSGSLAVAERGGGAYMDGGRVEADQNSPDVSALRGAIYIRFLPADRREAITRRAAVLGEEVPRTFCAGADYPAIASGRQHFSLYWRTLPWDHVPGALFLTEVGGKVARFDGSAYRPASRDGGLLAALNPTVWERVHAALLR